MNLTNCQIFTPTETVKFMLDQIGYEENIFGKKIIDNSCGNGSFLIEVARRFIICGLKNNHSKSTIKNELETCLVGCDIDEKYVTECISNLNLVAMEYNIKNVNWNITTTDGLFIQCNGSFDYVIGNPPYIAYSDLDDDLRLRVKDSFVSCAIGKFDYSYAFIEKGLKLLNSNGIMIYITPSNMFKTAFGDKLRQLIKPTLKEIIECSELDIFGKVLTSPSITVYQNNINSDVIIYRERKKESDDVEKVIEKNILVEKWDFTGYVCSGTRRFGDNFKVSNSIATLLNEVYIKNIDGDGNIDGLILEDEILRSAISPRSGRYDIKQKIIFPYCFQDNALCRYSDEEVEKKFPLAYKYLLTEKERLEKRDKDKSAEWFEYGRSQAVAHLNQEKLLMSSIITRKVLLYKLDERTIPYSGLYITKRGKSSLDTAKTILQTNNCYNYLLSKGIKLSGQSIRISSKDIEEYKY